MPTRNIYLDHNASTPLRPEVFEAMLPYLDPKAGLFGNPSSAYILGQAARRAVENSRGTIAKCLGSSTEEIIFTASGSESLNTALKGVLFSAKERNKGHHFIISAIEHDAVWLCAKALEKSGFSLTVVPADSSGLVDPDDVRKAVKKETVLVSVMHANNETGTIQPVSKIGNFCRTAEILFHTDAVQSAGKISVNADTLNADLLSISAHKFHGPKGAGALYIRKGTRLLPLIHGHHESDRRGGTENVPAIVGMGTALELAVKEMPASGPRIARLRDRLEKGLMENIPRTRRNGHPEKRVPNTTNLSFECAEGEAAAAALDLEGISCSTGAACATGDIKASRILRAIGVPGNLAQESLRFSLGRMTGEEDIDAALRIIPQVIERVRALSPAWKE